MAATYVLISSQVLGSSTNSVTFSSIPQTYTDLKIISSTRGDSTAANINLIFNGDSGTTNWTYTYIRGDGSTTVSTSSSSGSNATYLLNTDRSAATANTFSNDEIYIPNYTLTTKKQTFSFGVAEDNTASNYPLITETASLYQGTAAITSLNISLNGGNNFVANSSFYLYGIKNA